jgi:hypothetical protein
MVRVTRDAPRSKGATGHSHCGGNHPWLPYRPASRRVAGFCFASGEMRFRPSQTQVECRPRPKFYEWCEHVNNFSQKCLPAAGIHDTNVASNT